MDVPADQLHLVADVLEDQDPFVAEIQGLAGHLHPARDRDRGEQGLVELVVLDLGIEVVVLVVEREEAVDLLGPLDHLVEVAVLLLVVVFLDPVGGLRLGTDGLAVGAGWRVVLVGPEAAGAGEHSQRGDPSHDHDATHGVPRVDAVRQAPAAAPREPSRVPPGGASTRLSPDARHEPARLA